MPGIQEQYIRNPELRKRMKEQIKVIHAVAYEFMKKRGITDIEVEFQPDDGSKQIFGGEEWIRQYKIGEKQLLENLRDAEQGKITDYSIVPYA